MPTAGVIQGTGGETRLVVSGGWSEAAAAEIAAREFDRLEFHGGEYADFGFLAPYAAKITSLAVMSGTWTDAGGLGELTSLRSLTLGSPLRGVDFSRLPSLESLNLGSWTSGYGKSLFDCRELKSLHVEGFGDTGCERIARLTALESLSLARGKLEVLAGLRHCVSLRSVQFAHLRKLADLSEMASLRSLRELELVERLPRIDNARAAMQAEQLRRLDLRGIELEFDDLSWLKRMSRLNVLGLRKVHRPDWDCLFASRELKKIAVAFVKPPHVSIDEVRAAAIERGLKPTEVKPWGVPHKPVGFVVEFRPEGSTRNLWFWRDP
jgi:hypothetical protein